MPKFDVHRSGVSGAIATGTPVYTGAYMRPGVLDYREIGSPTPIEWKIGDYVDYTRTGMRYYLYNIPQVKRQSKNYHYGAAFLYQNVQFHDASYDLQICPFRDLVVGDNRIHFSTQPLIGVFDNVAGIAERIGACLDDMFPGKWYVQVATPTDPDIASMMNEDRDYAVSNVNLVDALSKIYEIWPGVGWRHTHGFVTIDGVSVEREILTVEYPEVQSGAPIYAYGKGRGLLTITKTTANQEDFANRIYAYGNSRNMLPRWYNNQEIKDSDSVDIQHLMLPVSTWGKTDVDGDLLPDPAKAYVQDSASIASRGLRPKTVYFDGSGDYKDIYPSIREVTMKMIRDAKSAMGDTDYVPSQSWADGARADKVLSVDTIFDSGLSGVNGKSSIASDSTSVGPYTGSGSIPAGDVLRVPLFTRDTLFSASGTIDISALASLSGSVVSADAYGVYLELTIQVGDGSYFANGQKVRYELDEAPVGSGTYIFGNFAIKEDGISVSSGNIVRVKAELIINANGVSSAVAYTYNFGGGFSLQAQRKREKTFVIRLRQIGFDIETQAALGEGKTIAMRSGKCAGRSFVISSASYDSSTDTWRLEVIRSEDESLSQWFPNTDYPIVAGDEFVLLEIAMPAIYVSIAEQRLLTEAAALLGDMKVEQWQYTPEVDAKFMTESSRTIKPGESIVLVDADLIPEGSGDTLIYLVEHGNAYMLTSDEQRILLDGSGRSLAVIVDSVTISESEAPIPTWKLTLRDGRKKTYSDKASIPETSSKPVTSVSETVAKPSAASDHYIGTTHAQDAPQDQALTGITSITASGKVLGGSFSLGGINDGGSESIVSWDSTLKAWHVAGNLYADGFITAGGVGQSGGGGGGGGDATMLGVWRSFTNNPQLASYDDNTKIAAAHIPDLPYLPTAGGTMTGAIKIAETIGIKDGSNRSIFYADGTSVMIGAGNDTQLIKFQTGNFNLIHVKAGVNKTIWDTGNLANPCPLFLSNGQSTYEHYVAVADGFMSKYDYEEDGYQMYFYLPTQGIIEDIQPSDLQILATRGWVSAQGYLTQPSGDLRYLKLSGGVMASGAYIQFADGDGIRNANQKVFLSASGNKTVVGCSNYGDVYLNTSSNGTIYHRKGSTNYQVWDRANLPRPVSYTPNMPDGNVFIPGWGLQYDDKLYVIPTITEFDPDDYSTEYNIHYFALRSDVDAAKAWVSQNYLAKTGGTITGALTVQGLATFTGGIRIGSQTLPLTYDSSASAWKLDANFYATGFITAGGVGSSGGGGGTSEWYNIKMKREKRSVSGVNKDEYEVTIENYTSGLTNSSAYKMVFLRWRKGSGKSSSWHAPFLSPSSLTNNIPVTARSWAITARVQDLFNGTDWETIINTTTVQGEPLKFKASRNRKLRFGCAVYKYTGEGTYGWHRISNIAYVELFINNNGTIKKSIRLQ